MQANNLIQISKVSRYFSGNCAVDNVSFDLKPGEVLGFLGPNGAGKSTTMQMITGNLAPSTGEIRINGFDLIDQPIQAKSQIGYLPEQPPVYRENTVDEYLRYCAQLHLITKNKITEALEQAKLRCGLEDVGHRLIGNLSKGYQQRVGIAQAIIHDPPVLILDEPTVGLDPIQIRVIRQLIRELSQDPDANRSVILSTHILSEVQTICDRVQIIQQGKLIYNASIDELNREGSKNSFCIALHKPPALKTLVAIDSIAEAEQLDDNRFRIFFKEQSPVATIVQQSVTNNWGLFELIPDQSSLEEIFMQLTDNTESDVAQTDVE